MNDKEIDLFEDTPKSDDIDLFADDTDLFSEDVDLFGGDVDLFEEAPPKEDLFGGDVDLFEDHPKPDKLLLTKEEFFEKVKKNASIVVEDEEGEQYGIDIIKQIYNARLVSPRFYHSLKKFTSYINSFEKVVSDSVSGGIVYRNNSLNAVKTTFDNFDPKNFFIDNKNHVADLLNAFRRNLTNAINQGTDYSVDDFLNSNPKDLGLELNVDTVNDVFYSRRDLSLVRAKLEEYKKVTFYSKKDIDENHSYMKDSLISLMKNSFSEYNSTFKLSKSIKKILDDIDVLKEQGDVDEIALNEQLDRNFFEGITVDSKKISFTYPETFSSTSETFVCGNCKHEGKIEVPFISSVYFEQSNMYLPGFNRCPKCGAVNFVAEETYQELGKMSTKKTDIKDFLVAQTGRNRMNFLKHVHADKSGVIKYSTPKPELEYSKDDNNVWSAIPRYKSRIKRYIKHKPIKTAEENMSKFLSRYYDKDYDIRNRAIATIIHHLSDGKNFGYGYYLRYSTYVRYESALASSNILNHMDGCPDSIFQGRMDSLFGLFNIFRPEGYVFTRDDLPDLYDGFERFKNEFEYFKKMRAHVLREIDFNLNDLGNLNIMQMSISEDDYLDFMCCEDVRNIILKWADRMVIYSTLEDFMNLKLSTKSSFDKNFISKPFFAEEFVTATKRFFPEFSMSKDGKASLSLYPCQGIINLFGDILELQNVYSKDKFNFYVKLNDVIKKISANSSVRFDSVLKSVFNERLIPNLFENHLNQRLENFVDTYDENGRFYYYLGSQFSKEEIDETLKPYHVLEFSDYVSKRRNNESLEEYINRITHKDYDPQKDELVKLEDTLLDDIRYAYVGLDALAITSFACYNFQQIKEHNVYFAGKLIVDTLLWLYPGEDIFNMLNYHKETVNGLLDTFVDEEIYPNNFDDYKSVLKFTSLIYSDSNVFNEMNGPYKKRKMSLLNVAAYSGDNSSENELLNDFWETLNQDFNLGKAQEYEDVYATQLEYVKEDVQNELFTYLGLRGER